MAEHSATPYEVEQRAHSCEIRSENGELVAELLTPANAAFIVRCANSHAALVAACLRAYEQGTFPDESIVNELKAALDLATGETP